MTAPSYHHQAPMSHTLLLHLHLFLLPTLLHSHLILNSTTTLLSTPNSTFTLSFFSPNPSSPHLTYLGISYSLPTTPTTFIWVANRLSPLLHPSSATLSLSPLLGHLSLSSDSTSPVWTTPSAGPHSRLSFLDSGNLILYSSHNQIIWQSFDYPSDTWLPGMNITSNKSITSWLSQWDPSPGRYSLRLRPSHFGEVELVYNDATPYWRSGNWTGSSFLNVPEMTAPYIYRFYFDHPFTETASFGFDEVVATSSLIRPLTRFHLDFGGLLQQHTWSSQTQNWNTFWARPETRCRVYGFCGPNGVCFEDVGSLPLKACGCPVGFRPSDEVGFAAGEFSGGCRRNECGGMRDGFEEIGYVGFEEAVMVSVRGVSGRRECEEDCLKNCSCVGVVFNEENSLCKNVFGSFFNLHNLSVDSVVDDGLLYLRVGGNVFDKKSQWKHKIVLIAVFSGLVVLMLAICVIVLVLRWVVSKRIKEEEEVALAATHLRVFSHKELHLATRGFSEKVGHGGFGTVFRGTLTDSSLIAVKCLERPGSGGEKEFRAEVCTIGNVQHVNLVRLRGFCSENSHRLLVYDYMPNGSLSGYLKKDGMSMSWDVRFRVAMGTAKALAYLHEECRDCIIHCDIKPENILLDWDYTPKVSDFGLAKLIGRDFSRVLATMRGTWGYVAPEWISGVAITTKADVYSYGMTMLELIGGRRNVEAPPPSPASVGDGDGGDGGEKWFFPPWAARLITEGKVAEVVDPRLGGTYDRVEVERLGMVAVWCIQDEEMARPSMGMVVKMLEGVVDVGVPPPPKLLQALVSGESFPGVRTGGDSGNEGLSSGDAACGGQFDRVSIDSLSSHSPGVVSHLGTKC